MDAIEVKGLCVKRGNRQIISDLSFCVERGSFTVLSGPSGCGKSTILMAIQGLIGEEEDSSATGEIRVNGNLVTLQKRDDSMISYSGFLMQNVDAQVVNLISEDELVFGMENRGFSPEEMEKRSREYEKLFDIQPQKEVLHLSGGQKQRLLIASCLCTGHDVLLLDEPFANLDRAGVEKLRSVLRGCCAQGTTVLCVEHRLEEVCQIADRVLWLEDGDLSDYREDEMRIFCQNRAEILNVSLDWNCNPGSGLLSVRRLNARRGKNPVLQDLDMELQENETRLLLGPNGCGKTTLLRFLCGLSKFKEFSAEALSYEGKDYRSRFLYGHLRKQVGFVFQNPVHQLFMKTVDEELLLRGADGKSLGQLLDIFGIAHLKDRHPYSLSMGEKRRVSVAAAAASGAKLFLLDEPTIGQDYGNLLHIAQSLHELQKRTGNTLLLSTHDTLAAKLFGGKDIRVEQTGTSAESNSGA